MALPCAAASSLVHNVNITWSGKPLDLSFNVYGAESTVNVSGGKLNVWDGSGGGGGLEGSGPAGVGKANSHN